MTQSQAYVKKDLDIARQLARWGVPLFLARPDLDPSGRWRPTGGHRGTGYWFPDKWQLTKPDPAVVDRWRPGMALCAVMGCVVDLLDTDPRNGGDASRQELMDAGSWPRIWWQASTPSDGLHDFVATMGVGSRDSFRPGLDVKAGKAGEGHGFAFIAPTVKLSKTTGELRAYRWILPPTTMPTTTDDTVLAMAALVTQSHTTHKGSRQSATTTASLSGRLEALPDEEPCHRMQAQADHVAKALASGKRHEATLGPIMQLVRLGREGHRGLRRALTDLSKDFVSRVSDERDGGAVEAQQEWDRSVDGALMEVLGKHGKFPVHPACDCKLAELQEASQDPALFSNGMAGVTERRILGYLIEAARLGRSVLVAESQRQIAEAIDRHQPTVSHGLKRLEALGWIRRLAGVDPLAPTPYLLLVPEVCMDISTKEPSPLPAGSSVDTTMHPHVHRLFGPAGLGPGVAETFAALPEYRVKMTRGYLVRNLAGHPVTPGLLDPWQGIRQIPRPASAVGMTVGDLVEVTGKHSSTIRRHLKKLLDGGLVFEKPQSHGQPRWWRLRFDPDQIADRDDIPETGQLKADRHIRDRRSFHRGRIRFDQVRNRPPGVQLVHGNDVDTYVDTRTGEVRWIDTDPPETDPDGTSGLS
jgi:DNA-binding transcriptional ArsR family regulator